MANFLSLPKSVQKAICRLYLVQDAPVDLATFDKLCHPGKGETKRDCMPSLVQVFPESEDEFVAMFYSENIFEFKSLVEVAMFSIRIRTRHRKWVRNIIFSWKTYSYSTEPAMRSLASYKELRQLTIRLDEAALTEFQILSHGPDKWHPSLGLGPQLRLRLLHLPGLNSFRSMRGLKDVRFVPLSTQDRTGEGRRGPIQGGLFETLIKHEIAQPTTKKRLEKREGTFRIFDLPPELRNRIYAMLLVFPGVTYPTTSVPTSTTCRYRNLQKADRDDIPIANSALDILLVNRQIHEEAEGLFYDRNDLVFSYPAHLQAFVLNLGSIRLGSIRSLTLFHKNHNEGGVNTMDNTLVLLRLVPNLKKLHLIIARHMINRNYGYLVPEGHGNPGKIAGVRTMFALRGVTDIKVRDVDMEDRLNECGNHMDAKYGDDAKAIFKRQAGVLKHFNRGLEIARRGELVRELYTNYEWHLVGSANYPSLTGSKCSYRVGCLCKTDAELASQHKHGSSTVEVVDKSEEN